MSTHGCCVVASSGVQRQRDGERTAGGGPHSSSFLRRCLGIAEWMWQMMIPGAILVLIPKCPLCVVAYIALATGVGLSVSTATYLRLALIVLCVASILYLAVRHLRLVGKGSNRPMQALHNDRR